MCAKNATGKKTMAARLVACLTCEHQYVNKGLLLLGDPVEVIDLNSNEGITMKNVLFATTALVALAGAAAAEVSFSGDLTAGYNDEEEGGLFFDTDLDLSASVDMGDNVTATLSYELMATSDNLDHVGDVDATVEIAYTGDTLSASLKFGDLGDKGASEYFYADRDGMAVDVENHDSDRDVRALVEFGNFGVAVGCEIAGAGDCDGMNVGLGATFGSVELGVGYDDDSNGQAAVTAVSADATFGAASVGVSYADSTADTSIGVAVSYDVNDMITVGAYFASNDVASDAYGVSVDYASGPLSVGVFFDSAATDEYGIDVAYDVNDQLTASAGYFSGANDIVGTDDVVDDYFYVGIDYAVNDAITATIAYSNGIEVGGPEYRQGISALITASF